MLLTQHLSALLIVALASPAFAQTHTNTGQQRGIGTFSTASSGQIFSDWQPYRFKSVKKETRYSLVKDQDIQVIRADSNGGASGLIKAISIDTEKYTILKWR